MREIKFRAWDTDSKKMVSIGFELGSFDCERFGGDPSCELMQYTGLKDKNGKEIYEGDIVLCEPPFGAEWGTYKAPVTWDEGGARWIVDYEPRRPNVHSLNFVAGPWSERPAQIIGNIYENPELMK